MNIRAIISTIFLFIGIKWIADYFKNVIDIYIVSPLLITETRRIISNFVV